MLKELNKRWATSIDGELIEDMDMRKLFDEINTKADEEHKVRSTYAMFNDDMYYIYGIRTLFFGHGDYAYTTSIPNLIPITNTILTVSLVVHT